ncbi:MAG: TolC family protein [Planctomycetales bacterium]|nr:TolC family protein [Planctomycetales bacterium]
MARMCEVTLRRCWPAIALIVLGSDAACAQQMPTTTAQRLLELAVPTVSEPLAFSEHLPPPGSNTAYQGAAHPNAAGQDTTASEYGAAVSIAPGASRSLTAAAEAEPSPGPPSSLTQPWWVPQQAAASDSERKGQPWELEQLIWLALENSPFVKAVLVEPQILDARAASTLGQFDPNTFVESIFQDSSDPVGNALTTGTASRLNDHVWNNSSGVRVKNTRGGLTEFSQDFNFKDSNSDFFVPGNQADTKMVLRYTQPLLRGGGVAYNRATYVVASLAAEQSLQEAAKQIQDHAYTITNSYWELVAARAYAQQIERGLDSLRQLRGQLAGRADLDSLRSQLLRADAAIYRQQASQAKAQAQIRAAEANLRAAVAAPQLRDLAGTELLPATPPADWRTPISREDELAQALNHHPEIQAIRVNLQAARVRLQVAENELRPTLNLVVEGYLRGLNGDFDAAKSFGDQFSRGAPSYSGGLSYARPYRNSASKAILRERRLELRRTLLELDHTLLTVGAEVESAVAQVEAAYRELEAAVRSTLATHAELEYLLARWQNAFLDGTQTSLLLDQLLNAEIQLIQTENSWARAESDHMLALAQLRRATGSLLPALTDATARP